MADGGPSRLKRWYWNYTATREKRRSALGKLLVVAENQHRLAADAYFRRFVTDNPAYADPRRLARFERQVFSQSGEDGAIAEIFKRIGTSGQPYFVEFGVGAGLENNSAFLLALGWRGLWFEVHPPSIARVRADFARQLESGSLVLAEQLVTRDNVQRLFGNAGVPHELDVLSIDIDSNDYWVWQAITDYRPRVVVIEYNALWPPTVDWIMPHEAGGAGWDGSSFFGASLSALTGLARTKGYSLVGCTVTGLNAFFVRDDLLGAHFVNPNDCAFHYEPARYHLVATFGHPRGRY